MGQWTSCSNTRFYLWKKHQKCFVCLEQIFDFYDSSIEHVIPRSLGGTNNKWNLSVSHRNCNSRRGNLRCRLFWHDSIQYWRDYKTERNVESHIVNQVQKYGISWIDLRKRSWMNELEIISLDQLFGNFFSTFYTPVSQPRALSNHDAIVLIDLLLRTEMLIEMSHQLDNFGIRSQWKLIFGMVFLDRYLKSKDLDYFLHGVWRIEQYIRKKNKSAIVPSMRNVLSHFRRLEPKAYERLENLMFYQDRDLEECPTF